MLIVISKFGWGMEFSDDQLKAINARRYRNEYFDKIAATEVNGTERRGSPPWCDDGAAPIALGVAAPRAISTGQIC